MTAVGAAVHDWAPRGRGAHPILSRCVTGVRGRADRAGRVAGEEARCDIGRGRAARPGIDRGAGASEAVEIKAGETLLFHGGGRVTGGLLVALAAARGGFRRALSNDRH